MTMSEGLMKPTEAELFGYFESLSNWGRWGKDDTLGTLNLVTEEHRRRAVGLVRHGRSVSCAWDIDTVELPGETGTTPKRRMANTGERLDDPALTGGPRGASASEFWTLHPHGFRLTHLDGLSHIFWDGHMYNGRRAGLVTEADGATELDIRNVKEGVVTRAVLIDVAAHRGVDWLEPGEAATRDEVEAILDSHGLEIRPGDAVILRTGYGAKAARQGRDDFRNGRAGWHASCLPWLREHDVAIVAADTANDAGPSGYPGATFPLHYVGIVGMGLWLVDNCNLERLAATCRELGTWEFCWTLAPLAFVGGTSSPVNPLALF
jgi:kynurenine formamidase